MKLLSLTKTKTALVVTLSAGYIVNELFELFT